MSMETTAWNALYASRFAQQDRRPFSRAVLGRILRFARGHRRALIAFLVFSSALALLAVATPCSPAGRRRDRGRRRPAAPS